MRMLAHGIGGAGRRIAVRCFGRSGRGAEYSDRRRDGADRRGRADRRTGDEGNSLRGRGSERQGRHPRQKIDLQIEDDQAKPEQSILSFNKLADLQNPVVVFTGFSGPSVALAPLATRRKIVTVNAAAQSNALGKAPPYLINTIPTIGYEIEILCKWVAQKGYKKAAILFENGTSGISGRDDYRKYCGDAGLTIVGEESSQFGQTDFRPALLKIADSKPEVMLVAITSGMPQMTQQYKQLGLTFKVMGTTFFKHPEVIADPGSEGFVHTQLRVITPDDVNARFKAKYGTDIEFFAFLYYNASLIMFQAIEKVIDDKKPLTGENVHAAIFQIGSFNSPIPMKFKNNQNTAASDVDMHIITSSRTRCWRSSTSPSSRLSTIGFRRSARIRRGAGTSPPPFSCDAWRVAPSFPCASR